VKRGIGNGLILTLAALFQAASSFAVQIALMRLLLPEDFGRFAMVLAGCSLVQTVLSWRLNVLIIRLPVGDVESPTARRYQAGLVWETVAATAVTLVWLAFSELMSAYALLLVLALTLAQWTNQNLAFFERGMAYGRIAMAETGSQLCGHVGALVLVLAGAGPIALYIREVVAIIARLIAYGAVGALLRPVFTMPRLTDLRQLWNEARGVWAEGLLEGFFSRLLIITAGSVVGLHGAGIFAQSQRLAMLPHQFMAPVLSRFAVNLFNRTESRQQRRRLLFRLSVATAAVLSLAVFAVLMWAEDIVPLIFGPNWAEAGLVLGAMTGLILFLSLFELLRSYCYAVGAVRPIISARLTQIAAFSILTWLLTNSGPTDAAGLGWVLSAAYAISFATVALSLICFETAKHQA